MKTGPILLALSSMFCCSTMIAQNPITPASHSQRGPLIAVNPTNPKNLIGVAITGEPIAHIGAYYSTNGGATWAGNDSVTGADAVSDPVLAMDPDGVAYLVYFNTYPMTGLFLQKSTNGGMNWSPKITVAEANGNTIDRPWLAVSPKRNANGVFDVYVSYTVFGGDSVGGTIYVRKSSTVDPVFQEMKTFPPPSGLFYSGSYVAVNAQGEVFLAYAILDDPKDSVQSIVVKRSLTGGSSFGADSIIVAVSQIGEQEKGEKAYYYYMNGRTVRVESFPRIAVDNSPGPNQGSAFLIWAGDGENGRAQIWKRKATRNQNGSLTWSDNDPKIYGHDQYDAWMPAPAVSPDGVLSVSFYVSGTNQSFPIQTLLRSSRDHGSTWDDLRDLSSGGFQIVGSEKIYLGDYIGLSSWYDSTYGLWCHYDPTNGRQAYFRQLGVGTIALPGYRMVTVDQVDNQGASFGKVGRWNQGAFTYHAAGANLLFDLTNGEVLRADQNFKPGTTQKYRKWDIDNNVTNHRPIALPPQISNVSASFVLSQNDVTIKTDLLDAPGATGGVVGFRDPWLIDYADLVYGGFLRNRGQESAQWYYPNSPFAPSTASLYKGVFLNENLNWLPDRPNYSVCASSPQTIAGFTSHFHRWAGSGAKYQDSAQSQTGVVFTSSSATAKALYKARLGSSLVNATGSPGQRKLLWAVANGANAYHLVYESGGDVWYTKSADGTRWTPEIMLSRGAGTAHNPSISEMLDPYNGGALYVVWVDATVRTGASGYDIMVRRLNLSTGQWSASEAIIHPDYPSATGYARSDARPVAVAYSEDPNYVHVVVAYEGEGTGIRYSLKGYQYYYQGDVWKNEVVGFTQTVHVKPSMALGADAQGRMLILTYDTGSRIYVTKSSYFTPSPSAPYVTFNRPVGVPMGENHVSNMNSSVDVDLSGRQHIVWKANDNSRDGMEVAVHRSRDVSGTWSGLTEFVSDFVEHPVVTSSVTGNAFSNGGTMLMSDGSVLLNYASTDGVSWQIKSFASYQTSIGYPNLEPKSDLQAVGSVLAKNAGAPYEVRFEVRNNGGGLGKRITNSDTPADPRLVTTYQRVDLTDTSTGLWFSAALGGVELKDQSGTQLQKLGFENVEATPSAPTLRSKGFYLSSSNLIDCEFSIRGKAPAAATVVVEVLDKGTGQRIATLQKQTIVGGEDLGVTRRITSGIAGLGSAREVRLALTITGLDISHLALDYVNVIVAGKTGVALAKGVAGGLEEHPSSYALYPNHPNPFNPSTTLTFDLPLAGEVKLSVVDILGREVIVVSDGQHAAGRYSVIWNGRDFRGGQLASGVYIARLTAMDALGNVQYQKSVKMLLAK